MSRFFVPEESVQGKKIVVVGKEAHHILDVMRLKALDKVVTFDGTGKEYIGYIKEAKRKSLLIEVLETRTLSARELLKITLIQAIPKKAKMDYIVEKSTELGADSITPILTERTIVNWDERKKFLSVERWQRIAKEASKQCGRVDVPRIYAVKDFDAVLRDSHDHDLAIMATLCDTTIRLKDALVKFNGGEIAIAIGPEGDFTPDEIQKAKESGFKLIGLGRNVLKSDTAGLAVLAILGYEFEK